MVYRRLIKNKTIPFCTPYVGGMQQQQQKQFGVIKSFMVKKKAFPTGKAFNIFRCIVLT